MTNEVMNKAIEYEVNGESIRLSGAMVKDYLVRGNADVSEQEVVMFLNLCRYQHLNPFLNEAYLVKFKDAPAQIITSKEAFMKRAESHQEYDGFEAGIVVEKDGEYIDVPGALLPPKCSVKGGWAKVYRKDRKFPVYVRINLTEFTKGQATWKNMPQTMIRKTALVNALREAFPGSLGAMYTEDEPNVQQNNKTPEMKLAEEVESEANKEMIDIDGPTEEPKENQKIESIPKNTGNPVQQELLNQFDRKPVREEAGF